MMLIDSHCHLDFPEFDEDRDDIIVDCQKKGITQFIVPGVTRKTWSRLATFANRRECIFPAYGLHPYFIDDHSLYDVDCLADFIQTSRAIAVGEVGLDYQIKTTDKKKQLALFNAQLVVARELNMPVILHVRKAHDDVIMALRKSNVRGGVVHAFNGSFSQAEQYIGLGFMLGFGGAMISPQAHHLRKLARQVPLSAIVLETDAPDMRPVNLASQRNTPLTILLVLSELAILRDSHIDDIANVTSQNVVRTFSLFL